jgi:GntR family transcriptional regulator
MQIQIQPAQGTPLYLQIVNQVKYLVASGRLSPGDEIPPIRALAEQLLVTPNTVARAYLELERAGVVIKRHGSGTFVAERPPLVPRAQRRQILADRADALLSEAHQLGANWDEVVEVLRARHAALVSTRP